MAKAVARLTSVKVSLKLGVLAVEGTWEADESERRAAWEMYVELVTRISVAELMPDEGLLREALNSLYTLFGTTREILRRNGPTLAIAKGKGSLSFGRVAVAVLNGKLRPILAKWHPLLLDYENTKQTAVSVVEHEKKWEHAPELRQVLNEARIVLVRYSDVLAEVAGVDSIASAVELHVSGPKSLPNKETPGTSKLSRSRKGRN
jgi:hypothetical protein